MRKIFYFICIITYVLLLQPKSGFSLLSEQPCTSTDLNTGIHHLLDLVGQDAQTVFSSELAGPVMDFVNDEKSGPADYDPAKIDSTTSAYYSFEMDTDLERFLSYAYNPAIPPQMFSPSSVRIAYLQQPEEGPLSWQWRLPGEPGNPQVVRFSEFEEVTPDLFTGAYYGYDVDRTLILLQHQGKNVFLSIARQRGTSEVGKKGASLGAPDDWNYLYSGHPGLSKGGLGWVKSYMYSSFSITVFVETEGASPKLRCGVFKWLNAGWAGINMVRREHIDRGLERYAHDLKKIIESRQLPEPAVLAARFTSLRQLKINEVREYLTDYVAALVSTYEDSRDLVKDTFSEFLLEGNQYLGLKNQARMRAVLELEYLKTLLGKPCILPSPVSLSGGKFTVQ